MQSRCGTIENLWRNLPPKTLLKGFVLKGYHVLTNLGLIPGTRQNEPNQCSVHVNHVEQMLAVSRECMQVLTRMGCTNFANTGDMYIGTGNVATCMLACGVLPAEDPLLMSLMYAYRALH